MMIKKLALFIALLTSLTAIAAEPVDTAWVQIRIPVACIREEPRHGSEMSSQAIMGTPMMILEDDLGEWVKLKGPDGYEGYMNISSIVRLNQDEMEQWRQSPRLTVTAMPQTIMWADTTSFGPRDVVSDLQNGSIVAGELSKGKFTHVVLPDFREGWVETKSVTPIEQWASQPFDSQKILDRAYSLMGTPYLWGGCSPKSVDCSGLVRVAYYGNGILTLRDARQQIEIGQRIEPEDTASLRPADLLFFSAEPEGRITHVAMYDSDGRYVHSSGRVKTNDMTPEDPDFGPRYYRGASRIDGRIPSEGIWQIIGHPWYFKK